MSKNWSEQWGTACQKNSLLGLPRWRRTELCCLWLPCHPFWHPQHWCVRDLSFFYCIFTSVTHTCCFLQLFSGSSGLYLSRAQGIFQAGTTRGQSRIRNTRAHPGSVLHPGVWWASGPAGQQRSQLTHYTSQLQLIEIISQNPCLQEGLSISRIWN